MRAREGDQEEGRVRPQGALGGEEEGDNGQRGQADAAQRLALEVCLEAATVTMCELVLQCDRVERAESSAMSSTGAEDFEPSIKKKFKQLKKLERGKRAREGIMSETSQAMGLLCTGKVTSAALESHSYVQQEGRWQPHAHTHALH